MSHRAVMLGLLLGAASGLMFASVGMGRLSMLTLCYFSPLPLLVVGLRNGPEIQGAAIATALLTVGLLLAPVPFGLMFGILIAVPVHILTILAYRRDAMGAWYPIGRLVIAATGFAACIATGIILMAAAVADDGQSVDATIAGYVERSLRAVLDILARYPDSPPPPIDAAQVTQIARSIAMVLPGMGALSWMLLLALSTAVAQGLVVAAKRIQRPPLRLHDLALPRGLLVAIGIAIVVAVAGGDTLGYIARNVAVVLSAAFLLQGLGVIHTVFRSWGVGMASFVIFYIVLVFLNWLAVAVMALGLAEPLLRMRDRVQRRKDGGRS